LPANKRFWQTIDQRRQHRAFHGDCRRRSREFYDIKAQALADPSKVVVEYKGRGGTEAVPYEQKYICMQTFKDGKLIEFREYFDTWVVNKSFESLETLKV
jgi:ketosteroid isomerase-like protein